MELIRFTIREGFMGGLGYVVYSLGFVRLDSWLWDKDIGQYRYGSCTAEHDPF